MNRSVKSITPFAVGCVQRMLKQERESGAIVIDAATSAEDALGLIRQHGLSSYAAIYTDLLMPKVSTNFYEQYHREATCGVLCDVI